MFTDNTSAKPELYRGCRRLWENCYLKVTSAVLFLMTKYYLISINALISLSPIDKRRFLLRVQCKVIWESNCNIVHLKGTNRRLVEFHNAVVFWLDD